MKSFVELHKKLNHKIWEDGKLKSEVRDALGKIGENFLKDIKWDIEPLTFTFTGSLANFNYTRYSDIDLHIIVDYDKYDVSLEEVKDYFEAKKNVWNANHDILIKGYEVETYVQDIKEKHSSEGVYDILNDKWIVEPMPFKGNIDHSLILKKFNLYKKLIDDTITPSCDLNCIDKLKKKIKKMRQEALTRGGEYSIGNLVFKNLRSGGYIKKVYDLRKKLEDEELSLESLNFKKWVSSK